MPPDTKDFLVMLRDSGRQLGNYRSRRFLSPRHLRDLDPEFEQFAVDSRTSPGRICVSHFADEVADFIAR